MRYVYKLIALLVFSIEAFASTAPFRIAALYSQGRLDYSIDTYGPEAICITKAAVAHARKNGLNVALDIVDSRWSPTATGAAATNIINGHYDAAVGTITSQEALVAADMLNDASIPFVTPTATHPAVTLGKPFVVRVLFNDETQAVLLAKLTITELKPKTVAVIRNTSNPYSDFIAKRYAEEISRKSTGIRVTDFPIFNNYSEFGDLMNKVAALKPDLVFVPLWEPQVVAVYTGLAKRKAKVTLLASDTIDGKAGFIKLLEPMPSTMPFLFSSSWSGRLQGTHAAEYQRLHQTYCPLDPPSRVSAAAYDAISLILNALKQKPGARKKELIAGIRKLNYSGLTGKIDFKGGVDPVKPIELFRIENGQTIYWKRYE